MMTPKTWWAEAGELARQVGKTTATCEAAKKLGGTVVVYWRAEARHLEKEHGVRAVAIDAAEIRGLPMPFMFDPTAVSFMCRAYEQRIATLEKQIASYEAGAKAFGLPQPEPPAPKLDSLRAKAAAMKQEMDRKARRRIDECVAKEIAALKDDHERYAQLSSRGRDALEKALARVVRERGDAGLLQSTDPAEILRTAAMRARDELAGDAAPIEPRKGIGAIDFELFEPPPVTEYDRGMIWPPEDAVAEGRKLIDMMLLPCTAHAWVDTGMAKRWCGNPGCQAEQVMQGMEWRTR